jgi:flagellar motor switch protein FliN
MVKGTLMNDPEIVTESSVPVQTPSNPENQSVADANLGIADAEEAATTSDASATSNLSLLLDAELEATIRFGSRQLPLREILAFVPGDVLELEQHIDEPAQLIVSGRVIARGEVVVVDGNFGLRITEVSSTSQRAEAIGA